MQLEALAVAVCGTDGKPVARLEVGSAGSATPRQGLSLVHFLALPTPLGRRRRRRTHFRSLRGVEAGSPGEAASGRAGSRAGCRRGKARAGSHASARGGGGASGGGGGGGSAVVPGSQRSRPGRCDRGLGLPPPASLRRGARRVPPRTRTGARAPTGPGRRQASVSEPGLFTQAVGVPARHSESLTHIHSFLRDRPRPTDSRCEHTSAPAARYYSHSGSHAHFPPSWVVSRTPPRAVHTEDTPTRAAQWAAPCASASEVFSDTQPVPTRGSQFPRTRLPE